jgi:hypothetical protein
MAKTIVLPLISHQEKSKLATFILFLYVAQTVDVFLMCKNAKNSFLRHSPNASGNLPTAYHVHINYIAVVVMWVIS